MRFKGIIHSVLGPRIDHRKVRQVDQNGPNGKTPGFDPGSPDDPGLDASCLAA